jgi:hypothetical protein
MIVLLLAGTVLLDIEREPPFPEDAPRPETPAQEAAPTQPPPTPAPPATPPWPPPRAFADDCRISVAKYALESMSREDREALAAHIRDACGRSW